MNAPILSTKLNVPPPRPGLVPRSRLIERLDEGASSKLILVCAPAGFGKTTLLSTWLKGSTSRSAWLSLDPDDNDFARFIAYLVSALQIIVPEIGQTALAMLHSTQPLPKEALLTVWINELSTIPHDFYLFLDDYHLIESQEIHSAFAFLVEHLPHRMHLVVASRSDPPLPLSRLRARGQLLELRQAELRFTADEAAEFLNQSIGLTLTAEQVAALEARTEGWIAGLQLAALSMRGQPDPETFIEAFGGSHRFIIDYLADEVYSQQPAELRDFLRETSILDRFTASLCEKVTGRTDAAESLRTLEDANLFLIPLDDQRQWYRYHHLFHDFLRTRLVEDERTELHHRASRWFMSQRLLPEATKHILAAGDTEMAVQVISQAAVEAFNQAAFQSVISWLDTLPESAVRANPQLATYKGFALFLTRSAEHALPYAEAAEKSLLPHAPLSLRGQIMSLQAHLALCEDQVDYCIQLSRDALEYLDEDDHFIRNLTLNVLGQVLEIKGDVASAVDIYRQAFESGWRAGDRLGALVVFTNLVFALNELGRRREALAWCHGISADPEVQTARGKPFLDAVYLTWSLLAFEANEIETAREYSQQALDFLVAVDFAQGILWGNYILARVHLAVGEYDRVRELVQQSLTLAARTGAEYTQGTWFTALEAQTNLECGDLSAAAGWAEKSGLTPQDSPHHWSDHLYFTYTRILLAQNQFQDAQSLLENMEALAAQAGRQRKVITIHLLQALTLLGQGETQPAIQRVERALKLAVPEDYRRVFLDEGPLVAGLLPKARHVAPAFVDELLLAFRTPGDTRARPADGLIDSLTERELEVLRLVAKGLSNREIAEVLIVTVGTVKKHLNNTFTKLNVSSRTQAVAAGRELGLLE